MAEPTDLKTLLNEHPAIALGIAFGGGLLLGRMMASGALDDSSRTAMSAMSRPRSVHQEQMLQTWNSIKGALIGIAALRITEAINDVVPGFREQFHRAEGEPRHRPAGVH